MATPGPTNAAEQRIFERLMYRIMRRQRDSAVFRQWFNLSGLDAEFTRHLATFADSQLQCSESSLAACDDQCRDI
jgi:hypothetical protein